MGHISQTPQNLRIMRSKPHKNQPPWGAEQSPENATQPRNPMENFRALVMAMTINCTPNKSLSPAQEIFVQQKLQEVFPDSKSSPDHPPYSWMILKAIENLDEEGGSTEEAISKYIVRENPDLPWAHATLLTHHLRKLCESKEIFETVSGYYALSYPYTDICTTSSPKECISSNQKSMHYNALQGKMCGDDQQGEEEPANLKVHHIQPQGLDDNAHVEPEEQAEQDFVSRECCEDEEQQLKQVHELGKRRLGKAPKRMRRKLVIVEEEEEEEEEIDVQVLGLDGSARKEPNKQLNREQELEKGKRRSSWLPKRSMKNNDLEEQTNAEIHVHEEPNEQIPQDFASEECNKDEEQQQPSIYQKVEKGKRKHGKPHKNAVEEMTNSESDIQPQEPDDAENENEEMQRGQEKGKRKAGRRQQQHLQLQTCRPKTKSSEGPSMKPSTCPLQSSNQKNIKHEGSAKPQEIRRSTRISIATSKKGI